MRRMDRRSPTNSNQTFASSSRSANEGQIAACVENTVKIFGGVDFLVNLACVYVDNALDSTRQEWLESYNINVVGGVLMLKAGRPHMAKRGGGAVVNFRKHQRQSCADRAMALSHYQGRDPSSHAQ